MTGSGSRALDWVLSVAGASRTVLEALVPYGRLSMADFLGHEPDHYVSPETAKEMSRMAYRRALKLREHQQHVIGLASTATVATDRPKRGEHRCCVAAWDEDGVTIYDLKLAKGSRDRSGEEETVSRLTLMALAESCGIEPEPYLGSWAAEPVEVKRTDHGELLKSILAPVSNRNRDGVRTLTVHPDGAMVANKPIEAAVLAGSFNPMHQGHEGLAHVAAQMLETRVVFEVSVVNADKPPLEEREVRRRLKQFHGKWKVILTRAPTFQEKAAVLPGCTFVLGWDTAERLVDPWYYADRETAMSEALSRIRAAGCRFLVAGRLHEGSFHTLADVPIPLGFEDLFEAMPESGFRMDISSTELRLSRRDA